MLKIIVGDNGSGKTTYLNKRNKEEGVTVIPAKALTPGESMFSKIKVRELIETSKDPIYIKNVNDLMKRFKLNCISDNYVGVLSGGELKILTIALLIGKNQKEISLDEPERDLSEENIKILIKAINELQTKISFNIVTHNKAVFEGLDTNNIFRMVNYELRKIKKGEWDDE